MDGTKHGAFASYNLIVQLACRTSDFIPDMLDKHGIAYICTPDVVFTAERDPDRDGDFICKKSSMSTDEWWNEVAVTEEGEIT